MLGELHRTMVRVVMIDEPTHESNDDVGRILAWDHRGVAGSC
jgi:hypothetical protein